MVDIVGTKDLTDELAAWFQDNIGLPTEALFYDIAAKALGELQAKAQEALKQSVIDDAAKRKLWASERGLIYPYDYMQKYGISEQELRTAVDTHMLKSDYPPGANHSFGARVVTDRPLTPEELTQLANSVMLTANQAAERLGVDRKAFDRLKKKHNLEPFEMRHSRGSEWPFAVYKLADVDRLKV